MYKMHRKAFSLSRSCPKYKEWKDFFDTDKQKYQADKYKRKALQEVKNNGYKNMTTRRASNKF